jgi:hypothetical protein
MATTKRKSDTGEAPAMAATNVALGGRVAATFRAAAAAGLTAGRKAKRISARAHEQLLEAAAERSGLEGSELLEYALAKVALEDDFAGKLLAKEGRVSRDVDLEF